MRISQILLYVLLCFIFSGCSSSKERLHRTLSKEDPHNLKYKGHYKIGSKYCIKDRTYTPKQVTTYKEEGMASWYGCHKHFHGKKTANGDVYNKNLLTAAHRTLPMPSLIKVTNLANNRSVIVMVNDRGPFVKNRILDLSECAAEILGFKRQGITKVRLLYLPDDTKDFLNNINLIPKEWAKAKKSKTTKCSKCSINCHIKLVNMKHKIPFTYAH